MNSASGAAITAINDYEQNLVARCRRGDPDALEQVFTEQGGDVLSFAYHMLGDWDDACDIRQETFLHAFEAIPRFRGQCSLKSWLLTICANLCRRSRSSRQRQSELLQGHINSLAGEPSFLTGASRTHDPFEAAVRSEAMDIILLALRSLPPVQREVIILREVHGLSLEQIGKIIGRTRGSVTILLFRARSRFSERAQPLLKESNKEKE